ncbi:MAG: hypothetical protein CL477_13750 [Acidobacteria bacterium]|jgi:hypothetical protein|nr:hypothetical protein [Acidobacteriota bacterium]HJN43516.1 hypothetical protein [Vicinamibacterales bacterium]|tara:strand:+ start:2052 stop:2396 length:345 start_codon:yes stop_codon:yes gene_type:complete
MKRDWGFTAAKMALLGVAIILVTGVVVMFLWNALVPEIFGGPQLTWIQAVGLLILVRILAGGRGHGGFGGRRRWRERWKHKVANMSPEQREKWRAEFDRHCRGEGDGDGERQTR